MSAMKKTQASASQREGAHTSVLGGKMLCVAKEQKGAQCDQMKRLKQSKA